MRTLATGDRVPMRREVILDDLRANPWSSARAISNRIYEQHGGIPAILGGLWIPPWSIYDDLVALERKGLVERRKMSARTVWWRVSGDAA